VRAVVIAFALGAGAFVIAIVAAGMAVGVLAPTAGWAGFRVGIGPFTVLELTRDSETTSTTFGSGILAAAILGGALNALAAAWLRRRPG
jgi:hypothetical protein